MKVGIVGLGLIGGSMAKSIKRRTGHTVYGIDLNDETMMMARMCGAIDGALTAETLPECDLILVAEYECGFIRTPEKAKKLMETLTQLESEYGVAWQCRPESDEAIARIDYVLQKVCGGYFQPFFERNDLIKDWWDK